MQLLSHGAVIAILLFGGVLASVLGLVLLVLYKRTIGRHMRRVVAVGEIGDQDNCPRRKPLSQLTYSIEHPPEHKALGSRNRRRSTQRSGAPQSIWLRP
jgi:hypothetical protein